MLEVQGAKPLTVQRVRYEGLYFKNTEFYCKIYGGSISTLTYAPKCDIETYMYTWKNQILARYIHTCIQYYAYIFPKYKRIELTDKLSIHCGRSITNSQFLYLTNLSIAFFMEPWCVRYLNAVSDETIDTSMLQKEDNSSPLHLGLIMARSYIYDGTIVKKYEKLCESYKTIYDFLKVFTKRSRFKDCLTWMPGMIYHTTHPLYKTYKVAVNPTSQTFDSVVCEDVEYFEDCPYIEDSASEIVIQNEIIYTMSFSLADVDLE